MIMKTYFPVLLAFLVFSNFGCNRESAESSMPKIAQNQGPIQHTIVYAEEGKFCGWPANNGLWSWDGKEILVGFSLGNYVEKSGHNVDTSSIRSVLCRSIDAGRSWSLEDPNGYVGDGGSRQDATDGLDFTATGFVMRVAAVGYLASEEKRSELFFSSDRGKTWVGPCGFAGLLDHPELKDVVLTSRTDYMVNGSTECMVFCSARGRGRWDSDRVFGARTEDAGKTFRFVSWVVPPADPHRAVMPSTVRCSSQKLVSAIRRRDLRDSKKECWIDTYISNDNGQTWSFLSKVADTGVWNGNPPALLRLKDGRLCCAYGNRTKQKILIRYSPDDGVSWGDEIVLRDGYNVDSFDDKDFGYPRLVQRADGKIAVMYYWSSKENPHHHIACTTWDPNIIK